MVGSRLSFHTFFPNILPFLVHTATVITGVLIYSLSTISANSPGYLNITTYYCCHTVTEGPVLKLIVFANVIDTKTVEASVAESARVKRGGCKQLHTNTVVTPEASAPKRVTYCGAWW